MLDFIYQLLGQGLITLIIIIFILIIIELCLCFILIKKNILIFPKINLFLINTFYSTIKKILKILHKDEQIVDRIGIKIMNRVNKEKFKEIPANETLIFLPHCLRDKSCEAHLQKTGLLCNNCGKCVIHVIKNKAEPKGYKLFIVPGSSFVKKIVQEKKFKTVIGIACCTDLNQMMTILSDFYPQGILLTKSGCFETKVNIKEILKLIDLKN